MAEEDDDLPRALRPKPTDLDVMGIEELNEYIAELEAEIERVRSCLLYTSPSPRDLSTSRMPSSA